MTVINKDIARRMAELGRIGLSGGELAETVKDLEKALNNFSSIQKVSTKNVPTYDNATGLTNVTRQDQAAKERLAGSDDLVKAAPDNREGYIKVHAVFGNEADTGH